MLLTLFATASFADKIKVISTDDAPCSSSYSQGMQFGDSVFVAGQIPRIPLSPTTTQPCPTQDETRDITYQTIRVMDNIKAILEAAKLDFCDVVMATVYLKIDWTTEFTVFNNTYTSYFTQCLDKDDNQVLPARATVGVAEIPGNTDFKVEISVIATKQKGK